MNEKTKRFIKSKFQDYYRTAEIHLPPDFTSREWGFILFDEMPEFVMRRHKAFGSRGELQDYLSGMVPAHAYYSVAYYEYPNAPKMKEKNWLSADLIFDLDADHLPGAPQSYADMLEHVKQESLKLYGFLNNDFGFDEKDIHIVFSGGRGYHFHISTPAVRALGSAERREIVDYVSSTGLEVNRFFGKKEVSGDAGRESAEVFVLPSEDEGGWGGRINRYIISYLSGILKQDDSIKMLTSLYLFRWDKIPGNHNKRLMDFLSRHFAIEWIKTSEIEKIDDGRVIKILNGKNVILLSLNDMKTKVNLKINGVKSYEFFTKTENDNLKIYPGFKGIGEKKIEQLVRIFSDEHQVELLKNGKMESLSKIPKPFFETLANQAVSEMSASVDEPVTADIKRLIRLPGSLHGGSGMRVTTLSLSELETFDPLNDAVVFSDESVQLKVIKPFSVQMKGNEFVVEEGDGMVKLPEYAAMYLMCRGVAEYGSN
ncbi:MAG TPA: DNA primase catalytic subunit PriS [Methanosarcinaceae archaeon]|nr:DNA primase catalytic subunit PriS [Methanosarcinaceae archaeon]